MEAYRQGEGDAFEVLLARHARPLYNFLLRSVHNRARAEELLQEVLVRVIRSKNRYKRSAKFTTWVYTIARNLCVDESRRARFREHASLDAPRRNQPGHEGRTLLQTMPAEQIPTDALAEAPRIRRRLTAAIDALPTDQREVFLMRQVAGLSFREIGESVGAPENTVKSRMRYALEKLRQELADLDPIADHRPASSSNERASPCGGSAASRVGEPPWGWSGSASDG
jgi:RNA polymerase sigma-70 factor, ECF subfamily